MDLFTLDIGEIGDLASQVAINGAIRATESIGDGMFEFLVGLAVLIYEMFPDA